MSPDDIANLIIDGCVGTCQDIFGYIDLLIANGDFTQEDFNSQEQSILNIVDSEIFTCESCGWNCEIPDMSEKDYACAD